MIICLRCDSEAAPGMTTCQLCTDEIEGSPKPDMVNHPPHYQRGPAVTCPNCSHTWTLHCIDVIRYVKDGRLFTAMKYIWQVAFGGKQNDVEDIGKSRWYLTDWLEHHD